MHGRHLQKNLNSLAISKNGAEISWMETLGTLSMRPLADTSKSSEAWSPVLDQLAELQKTSKLSGTEALFPISGKISWFRVKKGLCVPDRGVCPSPQEGLCVQGRTACAPALPDGVCCCINQPNKRYYFFFKNLCIYILGLSQLQQCCHLYKIKP